MLYLSVVPIAKLRTTPEFSYVLRMLRLGVRVPYGAPILKTARSLDFTGVSRFFLFQSVRFFTQEK